MTSPIVLRGRLMLGKRKMGAFGFTSGSSRLRETILNVIVRECGVLQNDGTSGSLLGHKKIEIQRKFTSRFQLNSEPLTSIDVKLSLLFFLLL